MEFQYSNHDIAQCLKCGTIAGDTDQDGNPLTKYKGYNKYSDRYTCLVCSEKSNSKKVKKLKPKKVTFKSFNKAVELKKLTKKICSGKESIRKWEDRLKSIKESIKTEKVNLESKEQELNLILGEDRI